MDTLALSEHTRPDFSITDQTIFCIIGRESKMVFDHYVKEKEEVKNYVTQKPYIKFS